ncbi:MAG: hypothetical protein COA37_12060 [Hoeflea sp.]|uniref:GIY-YIG nuclease family protein n=1 Tax=Hoeflea sp. TaxID=1940281 RepID=UPI000C0CDF26|nr:GIY-YIG nuclease family protein [Hoeflea sp.]PHR22446.1 MAG: hypothetical protein COA37_12060 [Hoeflea sp.]
MKLEQFSPEDRQIWVRAFYGFNPEEAGYIGFTHEAQREDMFRKMKDGDLVLIYGAVDSLTQVDLQRQILGFLEIKLERCLDVDRQNEASKQWKLDHSFEDRWTYGIKVVRAWRVINRVHIKTIAPKSYDNKYRFERTTKAVLLEQDEKRRAFSHPVYQVNVFGEPPIGEDDLRKGTMEEVLKPSKGIPPSFGDRNSKHEDGENHLYLMKLSTNAEMLLGNSGPHVGKALVKIGRSNDPLRRLKEVNGGFPERAVCRWALMHHQPFEDGNTAHTYETELKARFAKEFTSQAGEFYTGEWGAIERAFQLFCFSKMPKILAAPGKAKGVK